MPHRIKINDTRGMLGGIETAERRGEPWMGTSEIKNEELHACLQLCQFLTAVTSTLAAYCSASRLSVSGSRGKKNHRPVKTAAAIH